MKTKIMLVDDHLMFREALRTPLAAEPDFEIVAEAATGNELLKILDNMLPDVIVLDIALPDMNGIEVATLVLARHSSIRIVVLSGYSDRIYVSEMIRAGAHAYVVKSAGTDDLFRAIRSVIAGKVFLSAEVTSRAVNHASSADNMPPTTVLGKRELAVLRLLSSGMSSTEIADKLCISAETVKTHRRNIKHKLGISSTAELTRYAIREGLQPI